MTRGWNIAIAIVMWLGIGTYIVLATLHARDERAKITVKTLNISIVDRIPEDTTMVATHVVTDEKVRRWLSENNIAPVGRPLDSAGTRAIELALETRPEVRHVSAWSDLEGRLTVRIEPRTPAMRVITAGGYRFWLTDDGYILPDRGEFTALVPVVTGRINFPFPPSASGSYAQMRADNFNDYLARYAAIDAEHKALEARIAQTRAEIRQVRAQTPRRWWSAGRKTTFQEGKATRIAALETQRQETAATLAKLEKQTADLKEKEKKSHQSYLFLTKLANFVEFIVRDRFWAAQVVQIHVEGGANGEEWREPQIELIPRAGDHRIVLGELDGTERKRMENLRLYYLSAAWHEGWSSAQTINIKYINQIVCTQ